MKVRWAEIEYQPNLKEPAEPIRLGIVIERARGRRVEVILVGREPTGPIPELQLEGATGPFRDIVTNWFEVVWRSIATTAKEGVAESVVEMLNTAWTANLYLTKSQSADIPATTNLLTVARRRYEHYVGEKVPPFKGERVRPNSIPRWVNYTSQ